MTGPENANVADPAQALAAELTGRLTILPAPSEVEARDVEQIPEREGLHK